MSSILCHLYLYIGHDEGEACWLTEDELENDQAVLSLCKYGKHLSWLYLNLYSHS